MNNFDIYMWISYSRCGYLSMGIDIHNTIKTRQIFMGKYVHNNIDNYEYIHRYLYIYLNIMDIHINIFIHINILIWISIEIQIWIFLLENRIQVIMTRNMTVPKAGPESGQLCGPGPPGGPSVPCSGCCQ